MLFVKIHSLTFNLLSKLAILLFGLLIFCTTNLSAQQEAKDSLQTRIKELRSTPDFSIKDKNLCAINGINDYLLKPFEARGLLQKIITNTNKLNRIEQMKSPQVISKINFTEPSNVNLFGVIEDCLGDVEMLEELVQLFKQNIVEFIGKTKLDLKHSNIKGVQFNTHKIKAGLKIMKTDGLLRIVEQMHKVCIEDQDFKYLNFLFDCFVKEYPLLEKEIDTIIISYKNSN